MTHCRILKKWFIDFVSHDIFETTVIILSIKIYRWRKKVQRHCFTLTIITSTAQSGLHIWHAQIVENVPLCFDLRNEELVLALVIFFAEAILI